MKALAEDDLVRNTELEEELDIDPVVESLGVDGEVKIHTPRSIPEESTLGALQLFQVFLPRRLNGIECQEVAAVWVVGQLSFSDVILEAHLLSCLVNGPF